MKPPLLVALVLALALAALAPPRLALQMAAPVDPPPKLLTDRSWFSQVARVRRRDVDDALACLSLGDSLQPGLSVEGYELVERSALLGVCKHQQRAAYTPQQQQWGEDQALDGALDMELVPWSVPPGAFADSPSASRSVCPLAAAPQGHVTPQRPPLAAPGQEEEEGEEDSRSLKGPVLEYQYVSEDVERMYVNAQYRLKKRFDAGSHGEVWRATRRAAGSSSGHDEQFVLKRLFLELGEAMAQMGRREAHFGELLRGERHVTRFVEHFVRPSALEMQQERLPTSSSPARELWLVFRDEGTSLRRYLYEKHDVAYDAAAGGGASVVLQPSRFWHKLRTDARGEDVLREILRQLLQGVAALHARGITHRDIKPSNILLTLPATTSASSSTSAWSTAPVPLVKLADFGSAVDAYTLRHLYDGATGSPRPAESKSSAGPSQAEETREYQPPEVLFSATGQPYDYTAPETYDLWSVGVVFLEMLLGSPQVFLISPRARAKLDAVLDAQQRLRRRRRQREEEDPAESRAKTYLLHVLTHEFCIFQPAPRQLRTLWDKYALVSESCHFGRFKETVVARDPLGRGLQDAWGLDLLWRLLQWHPKQRISAQAALQHAFFRGAFVCEQSGRQFATRQELRLHEGYLAAQRARENAFARVVGAKYALPDRFTCPHCGRVFATAQSCEQHAHARRHDARSAFCAFEAPQIATAIRAESRPLHVPPRRPPQPAVGVALFQGRKKYMEDFVLVRTERELQQEQEQEQGRERRTSEDAETSPALGFDLYAVVDGHLGSAAATFVVENLPRVLTQHFAAIPRPRRAQSEANSSDSNAGTSARQERQFAEKVALRQTFLELHEGFLRSLDALPSRHHADDTRGSDADASAASVGDSGESFSGCTLTVVLHFRGERRLVSANVGDSRALAWLGDRTSAGREEAGREEGAGVVLPLSTDHWPNEPTERARIESSGGFVSFAGLWRVVGQLAVSRSLGDRHLRQYVTAEPSVSHTALRGSTTRGGDGGSGVGFLVLASDGLWETMGNADVARFLHEQQQQQRESSRGTAQSLDDLAADLLTAGYVRGSSDNLAALLVELPA